MWVILSVDIDVYTVSSLISFLAFVAYALIGVVLIPALTWPRDQKWAFGLLIGYDAINGIIGALIVIFSVVRIGESAFSAEAVPYIIAFSALQLVLGWGVFVYGMRKWT